MPGLIRKDDIEEMKSRIRIDDVVSSYVALRPAGADSLKGLCPFHDEKTPSFHVRPSMGRWHCFGCGEGGDAITFVQKIENLDFVEAVEFLARRVGYTLRYEEDDYGKKEPRGPKKSRLIEAHRYAVEFYKRELESPAGRAALEENVLNRGFTLQQCVAYNIGYSPSGWTALSDFLRSKGFTEKELVLAGLATHGRQGIYDRFRGRLMWPIYSLAGEPIGFGARKVSESDEGPKYLNTPETPLYKKSQVLYGINKAKKAMAQGRRAVIVEGYTDVMAMQLAGIECAVATCGTAFGSDHVKIVRRLIGDGANPAAGVKLSTGKVYGGEVIFTFDGDAAGQKAAMRAFDEDQAFAAQTFVCIAPGGMDPCEVRMNYGDSAVVAMIEKKAPLFEFVITSLLRQVNLDTPEGRTSGLKATAPIVASIRDRVLRGEYVRELATWLGMPEEPVAAAVAHAHPRSASAQPNLQAPTMQASHPETGAMPADSQATAPAARTQRHYPLPPVTPLARLEREALDVFVQIPWYAASGMIDQFPPATFTVEIYRATFEALVSAGGTARVKELEESFIARGHSQEESRRRAQGQFIDEVQRRADEEVGALVASLCVENLHEDRPEKLHRYAWSVCIALRKAGLERQIDTLRSHLQRMSEDDEQRHDLFKRLMELEMLKRSWQTQLQEG